jgi:hypothetical protein
VIPFLRLSQENNDFLLIFIAKKSFTDKWNCASFDAPVEHNFTGVFIKNCAIWEMQSNFLFNFNIDCEVSDISLYTLRMQRIVDKMPM